ncbi:hypothetical protein C9439_01825 [archaeon SCG-AAA382B04]|nr:hypothetical protein C9439_01825 [archaeon SCG-AAA382B04]
MIGFLSDFGRENGYVGSMKAVAGSICEDRLIDISHKTKKHDVRRGAFILYNTYRFFPFKSVFVCVVDPGVGTERRGIAIETEEYVFVGPDNGLMFPAANDCGDYNVFELSNKEYMLEGVSETFDGRDVFAPIGAHIADGVEIEDLGPQIEEIKELNFGDWKFENGSLRGEIIFIDSFGNLVTNIPYNKVKNRLDFGDKISYKSEEIPFYRSYGCVDENNLVLTVGGHGNIEISANKGDAAKITGLKERDGFMLKIN